MSRNAFRTFPQRLIGNLYHVGTMDITKKSKFSHEGNGLSVSNCPDAWRRITEGLTHGKTFMLRKRGMKLLDFYMLTAEEKAEIQRWAVSNGYVEEATLYKSITLDEFGEEFFSLYESYEEALTEADDEEERVQPVDGLLPTQKMKDASMVHIELLQVRDFITTLYAEQVLDYDGIYWDELLDEGVYSAPRGVIFNSKLPSFTVTCIDEDSE